MRCFSVLFFLTAIVSSAKGDALSVGPFGINSEGLGLNGSGVAIGQIENGRPGKPLKDNSNYVHEQTVPTQVYAGTAIDSANSSFVQGENGLHATQVAGVMIASAMPVSGVRGVAPAANLHAAAFLMNNDDAFAVAANRLAGISNLYAINISGGRTPQLFVEFTDGNTHITQFVDWSSSRHDGTLCR